MIPKTLHHVWVGGPVPAHLAAWRDGWLDLHPGWECRLWHEREIDELGLVNRRLFDDAERIAGRYAGQLRSDVARYEILAACGGVYVDFDCEARRPFDDLLDVPAFVGWEVPDVWANNAVIGAVPGHPFLAALIERLPANVARHRGSRPNVLSGPRFLTPILADFPDVTIHAREAFYPYGHDELDRAGEPFPSSWCVHHWQNTRNRRRRPHE